MADEYTLIKTIRVSVMDLTGSPSMGYRVYFQLPVSNVVDFVDVVEADYNAETVSTLIAAKVEKHQAISEL